MKLDVFTSFFHQHYWGVPHKRQADGRLIVSCYECNAEREVKAELTPTILPAARPDLRAGQSGSRWREAR